MNNMYDKNKAKQLYNEVISVANLGSNEEQFYEKLKDTKYARRLYRKFDSHGIKFLNSQDEDSFLDSLGFSKPMEVKPESKEDKPKFTLDANREAAFRDTVSIAKDSSIPMDNASNVARVLPEKPAEQIINEHTPQQQLEAEGKQIGEDKVADLALSDNLLSESDEKLAQWHLENDEFIAEYENKMNSVALNANAHNLYSESFNPLQFLSNRKNKEDEDFINANSAKYDELIRQRDAIRLTRETADTMKQYADFDRSIAVGEQLSSYVDKGLLQEGHMKELRGISDESERKQALIRMYNQGAISEDTFNKILDLGDTSDKNGLFYGMFQTGKIADFATLGLNELARNTDILDIAKRYNNGLPINEDEKTLLGVYGKLMELQSKDRNFGFNAGMGMQNSIQFVLESLLTGGVGAMGKSVAKQGGKALLKKLGENAIRQATLTPLTPMMYNDYVERLTGMNLTDTNVTGKEKTAALWQSYAGTFAERFSETLGTIVGEYGLFNGLINNKFTRKHFSKAFDTMAKIADNPVYKTTAALLKTGGVTDVPGEFASEYSGNIINSILTLDAEPLAELFNPEFFGQVALQSVMMGGMGNVVKFTAGAGVAVFENRKTKKDFNQSIENLSSKHFDNPALESLKGELIEAINNKKFAGEDGTLESSDISHILSQINDEYNRTQASQNDKQAMRAVDNAIRSSVYRYGQEQAIMALVEDKIGEYLHDNGNVYEAVDSKGNKYFILADSGNAVVALDRTTNQKVTLDKNSFQGSIKETDGYEWAFQEFLMNIDKWNSESATQKTDTQFIPADMLDIDGVIFKVVEYNPKSNKYIVVDNNGSQREVDPNEEGVTPIYTEKQDTEEGTTDENTADLSEDNTQDVPNIDDDSKVDTSQENQLSEDSIEYDETGDPVWSKISPERAKQEIDSSFEDDNESKSFIADKIAESKKKYEQAEKKKPKATNLKGRKEELAQIKAEREQAKAILDYWNVVAGLYAPQPTQEDILNQPNQEGTGDAAQQNAPKVVDDSRDNPADARARGFKMINGVRYDRQTELKTAKYGDNVETKFAKGITAKGKRAVIEAIEAQPSHIAGTRNPLHFTPEMQPKDRTDKVSIMRADEIARNVNPQEITGGVTAYTGSPSVNKVGEGIQGNNRLDALKRMYELYPEKASEYKQYLVDHAAEWGLNPQDIASMNSPILVNVLDVTDEQAIQLGQKTAQDTESGGEQKISAPNVAQTLGKDMKTFAGILLRTEDEDIALDDVVNANGYDALKWLTQKKAITETQLQTALDEKGNITPEARQSLKDILSQVIFQGGNNNIRQQFAMLPKAAQKALLQTISRELDSAEGEGILKDIQEAIEVYSNLLNDKDFVEAKGKDAVQNAVNLWAKQIQMDFTEGSFVPEDRYSNFAIALAVSFRNNKMKEQAAMLNQLYDLLQEEGGDIFNPAVKLSKEEAVKQVYGVELNKEKQDETNVKSGDSISVSDSQESSDGRQGSAVNDRNVGQSEQDLGQTDSQGAVGDSQTRVSEEKRTRVTEPLSEEEYKEYQSKLDEIDAQIAKAGTPNQALIDERSRLFYNFLRRITNDPFSVVSEIDARDEMENIGMSQEDINDILEDYHDPKKSLSGIYAEGQILIFTENIKSIEDLRLTLVHERQHRLTLENWDYYYNEVTSRIDSVDELKNNLVTLSGISDYNNKTEKDMNELVGELISYSMMYVYTNKNYPNRLKELGLNEKLINFIKEIDYEQRGYEGRVRINQGVRNQEWYSDLFRSRRGSAQEDIYDESIISPIQQNERDTQPESADVGKQGDGASSTSEERAQRTGNSEPIEITEEIIDSLPVDDLVKLYAKQYLNGKQNTVTRSAYQTIKDYVQNESRVGTGDSSNADTAQLGGRVDDAAVQSMGTDGEQSGSVDRGQSHGDISSERPSGEDSQGSLFSIPGEESNSGVEQETSNDSDTGSDNSRTSSRSGRNGSNVRKSRRPTSGSRVSADAGERTGETQSSIDDKIKSADDLISDALAEIEDILKNSANTVGALGNAEMFKLIPATAKLGYALTKKGFYTFQKWFAQMQKHIGPLLQKHLTVEEVDEFIRDMWDTDFPFNGETHTVAEWASMVEQEELRRMVRMSLEEKIALQKSRENVETIVEDLDNIRESLPFLLPQQQEDVLKAETQFFSQSHKSRKYGNGKGIMFTNGTGTGKTYTGLGIVKRFVKQGKGRILIVTAQDKKIKDWIRDASNLGIEATQLKDTKDKGKGVVVTQFANMYQNRALLEEEWDLIVYDESHKLMESKDGRVTARAVMHHMLSNRDIEQAVRRHLRDHELFKKEYELRDELEYLNELYGKNLKELSQEDRDNFDKFGGIDGIKRRIDSINSELDTIKVQQDNLVKQTLKDENALEKAKKSVDNTKVVFLSASPFNTAKNLDYVESYIFSYNPEASNEFDGERLPSELREGDRNNFVLEKFPSSHFKLGNGSVQMRSEQQITNPEQSSQEEVDFSESLQDLGTLSGRTLDSEWDYSRQFPRFNFSQAETFNRMYDALQRGKYAPLMQYFKIFTEYNLYTEYFEAIKTSLSLDRIRQHVELGRKVVVFHRRRSNSTKGGFVGTPVNDSIAEAQIQEQDHRKLMEEFETEFADYLAWEKEANLDFANYQITEAFATNEEKAQYQEDLKKWRKKVEEAKLKGTKKVPDRPTMKTKTVVTFNGSLNEKEKRENADAFNNPNSDAKVIVVQVASGKEGVDLHDTTGKFQRAEINLYLPESPIEFIQAEGRIYRIGNKSNAIFEYPLLGIDLELAAFAMKINGRAQTSENLALGKQSRGLRDSISRAALSSRPIPVSNQQGIGGKQLDSKQEQKKEDFDDAIRNYDEWRDKQSDILEEKQVPDPIGERMTVWAMPEGGDTVLVPFAGEGSVARYVDTKARLVAYEPSMAKYSRLAMLCGGSGRKIENKEYLGEERYYNDNILYFKPYGDPKVEVNGISHAIYRLSDSGRMIVLTTSGDMLRERLANKYSFDESIITRAQIKLPTSVMGINKNNLEIIVIDKLADKELQNQAKGDTLQLDFSNITNETELWEALRGVQMPERIIDNVAKTRKRAEKALDNYIASSPLVKKRTEYSANGKNKLVPKIYKSNFECSFEMKVEGYTAFRYANYTKGNPKYSPRNVEALARAWDSRQEAIKNLEKNTDKYSIERVEVYKTMCNFIEALLDKTPPQLRNLARGISENVVTGQIDVPTLKDTIKGMLGGNAAIERLNDRVMKVAEAFGIGVEIVSENHPKFSDKSRGVQGFYSLNDNKIWIKEEYINSVRVSDEKKAEVLLHEAIHSVTSHALAAYQNGLINENSPLYEACVDIVEVYEAIKEDPIFINAIKGNTGIDAANNEYGLTDVHEMMAELANPAFRAALKAKKLWRQVINGIKRILGIQIPGVESEQTDALNVLENALEVLLDNLDVNTFNRYKGAGLFSKMEFNKKSYEIDEMYPNWLDGTTTESGKHSTQVAGTIGTYNKVGKWIENNLGKDVNILDASSGMGLGTQNLREKGFNIEDVEPYQSEDRKQNNPATYSSYEDIDKQYDYIISNAVLNVIPDDWRANVLHDMANRLKNGGRMFINTRKAGEEKSIKDKIELDSPQEVLVKRNGKIASYQRFFTPQELKSWVESELGDGYTVEVANEKNSGTKGLAAVVVTKNNNTELTAEALLSRMEENAETAPEIELTEDSWYDAFGDNDSIETPIGTVKMGANQIVKIFSKNRTKEFGMIAPTLSNPDIIIEESSKSKDGKSERLSSYVFIKTFEKNGEKIKFYASITVKKEGLEVSVSSHYIEKNAVLKKIYEGKVIYIKEALLSNNSEMHLVEHQNDVPDLLPTQENNALFEGKDTNSFDNTTDDTQKSSKLYRQSSTPLEARQHSEDVMRESIDKMAQDLGVNAEYVSDEKQLDKKGWYDPKDGKVYVNLSAHETIADAKATYLHEVAGHFGLRGLLKEEFESTMEKVFNSLPENIQNELLNKYGDKTVAAEEYLSSMAENDIEPNLVEKVLGFIREALRSIGVIVDNYTNGDLEYLLWRSKNNLRNNAGYIEAAAWGAKDKAIRYRLVGRPAGYSTNTIEMDKKDELLYAIQDRMRPVKKLMDEIIDRGGQIKESSDAYSQDFLTSSRAAAEIEDFKNTRYEPLANAIADAMKVFTEQIGMTAEQARKAVDDYLYARHAPERNKHICVNEIVDKGMDSIPMDKRHLVNEAFVEELKTMAGLLYDNQFRNGKNQISPQNLTAEQTKLAIIIAGVMQKKALAISKETAIDGQTGQPVVRANNRSGMSDAEAEMILKNYYTAQTKSALDEVSARVKDCTNFTLEKWLEYGLISQEDFDTYQSQYEHYIPLRGWEESEDIDYSIIPIVEFRSDIINLNKQAKGRQDKAENPLAHIASLAQSACITGNRNLIRQKAFNMVVENEALIRDLATIENTYEIYDEYGNIIGHSKVRPSQKLFKQGRVRVIRDKDYLWHKTPSQLSALQVGVMIDGVRHVITFHGNIGLLSAISINGSYNNTSNILAQYAAKATRFISSNLTARNVYFLGKNMFRDLGFGNFAYFIENGAGKTLRLNKYYLSAMRTAAMDAMGADESTYQDSALYKEFKLNGGQTGYVQMYNIDKLSKQLNKMIDKASNNNGVVMQQTSQAWDVLLQTFDVLGKASENAMRFAVYKVERESGASPREAAIRAKEITVNFNKQGVKTKSYSSAYAFFNPAVQGAYRYAKLIKANPRRFATATAALIAIKFGLGLMCEALFKGYDEPEGENPYDRLSDYVKATNWVIPLGWLPGEGNDDKFLLIPLPQSVRASTYFADVALDVYTDKKDFGEAIKDFALFNVGEFMPFDIDAINLTGDNPVGSAFQAFAPTVTRGIVEAYLTNTDFMGNPIYKEPFVQTQDYLPQHQMAFKSTSPILVGASKFLNEIAGGDDYQKAGINDAQDGTVTESPLSNFMDINPARIEHVLSGIFGGLFKPVLDVYDTMVSMASEDVETEINSIALVNQFIKGPTSKPGYKKYYEMRDEIDLINRARSANKKNGESNDHIDNNVFNQEIQKIYKDASKAIKLIENEILKAQDSKEVKRLNKSKDAIILEAANDYRDVCQRRDKEN